MPAGAYFEGPTYDYFVKAVIFGDSAGGEPSRWAVPEDGKPDAWTAYAQPANVRKSFVTRIPLSDHLDHAEAIAEAERHCKQDKLAHLLGAVYEPSTGRMTMP